MWSIKKANTKPAAGRDESLVLAKINELMRLRQKLKQEANYNGRVA